MQDPNQEGVPNAAALEEVQEVQQPGQGAVL